jgi:aminoglycoside phosphotransferase (APT) family kinase protein
LLNCTVSVHNHESEAVNAQGRILDLSTPLGQWVCHNVLPVLSVSGPVEILRTRLPSSHRTVRCSLRHGGEEITVFVLKEYFRDPGIAPKERGTRARREMRSFRTLESMGLCEGTRRAVRLLAGRHREPAALAVEYVKGIDVASLLKRAAPSTASAQDITAAERALKNVAGLLARFHAVSESAMPIWKSRLRAYPSRLLHAIAADGVIDEDQYTAFSALLKDFADILANRSPRLVHGDANPTNFMALPGDGAVAIDLERMGSCDPAIDLGFLAADVIHLMGQYGGSTVRARELAAALHEGYRAHGGGEITPKGEGLFLAMGLWRIARNGWLDWRRRRWLARVSRRVLEGASRDVTADIEEVMRDSAGNPRVGKGS